MICDKCIHKEVCKLYDPKSKLVGCIFFQSVHKRGEWIPVSERLPEYSGLHLISIDDLVTVANFTGTYFSNRGSVRVEVDAWQPLPKPYKEADNDT